MFKNLWKRLRKPTQPTQEEQVKAIVQGTAALELTPQDCARLKSLEGVYGDFILQGNSLPVFTYIVFDEKMMEFIKVETEVALPDQIRFQAFIANEALTETEVKKEYEKPFRELALHLTRYFPLPAPKEAKR